MDAHSPDHCRRNSGTPGIALALKCAPPYENSILGASGTVILRHENLEARRFVFTALIYGLWSSAKLAGIDLLRWHCGNCIDGKRG